MNPYNATTDNGIVILSISKEVIVSNTVAHKANIADMMIEYANTVSSPEKIIYYIQ